MHLLIKEMRQYFNDQVLNIYNPSCRLSFISLGDFSKKLTADR